LRSRLTICHSAFEEVVMPAFRVRIEPDLFNREFTTPVELGRQNDAAEEIYSARPLGSGRSRAVIARLDEDTLSRRHALLEPLDSTRFRITNLSAKVPIRLLDGLEIGAGASRDLPLPTTLYIGRKQVCIEPQSRRESMLRSLPSLSAVPKEGVLNGSRFPVLTAANSVELENLLRWLQTTMEVLQSAASSSEFFFKAARAVVDIVGLDSGRVLLLEDGVWTPVAVQTASDVEIKLDWKPSQNVLHQLCTEKRTFWQAPDRPDETQSGSLLGVEVVVAAPILDRTGAVIGALYGECRDDSLTHKSSRITKLEAMLVELLAGSAATGLARIEQEKVAVEADVRFKQFFTPELSRQLATNPDLLKGRDSEVSLLFVDIRGFSRISERLGPSGTVDWIGDVMGSLSDCVLAHRGVLVDYIGDELLAMWGAPEEQADHARLACCAALDMLEMLPRLNERWQEKIGEPMSLGIGVNTGIARVGNTGSRHKFKYGPLGNTVNLASRVQGATKYLRCRLLITELTKNQLDDSFCTRRLCKVRVVNIEQPVNLYELAPHGSASWQELKTIYEESLVHFEMQRFREATRGLGSLMSTHPYDGPALILMARAVNLLVEQPHNFDPVWELPGK
jgi:adenylate cyclase